MRSVALAVRGVLGCAVAAAQDTAIVIQPESASVIVQPPELPRTVAEEVVHSYTAATTTRLVGRSWLPAGNAWRGDVAVRSGPVTLRGRVEGTLLVINGDAVLEPGAVIAGDLIVVGGTVARAPGAAVSGAGRVYQEPLALRAQGDEIALVPPDPRRRVRHLGVGKSWGTQDSRSALTLATGGTL